MSFEVSADAYGRFMGRFAAPLAVAFADVLDVRPGADALDVGCGSGALTDVLVDRLGVEHVAAADPSPPLVAAVRARHPALDVRLAPAERLPFGTAAYDVVLAQLVVSFMADPVAGLREMARCTRPNGVVAASVWDHAGGTGPLSLFWEAVHSLDPDGPDESHLPGVRARDLADLFARAGLAHVTSSSLTVTIDHPTFDDWWEPYTLGVGPAGAYVAGLDDPGRQRLRQRCFDLQPPAPFRTSATAWVSTGRV